MLLLLLRSHHGCCVSMISWMFAGGVMRLHTTRSWDFLGLPLPEKGEPAHRRDVVVGVIDTGIWPESTSFKGRPGTRRRRGRWKGICPSDFPCNNKLVGARFYNSRGIYTEREESSARDLDGHGTHVAATIAGRLVGNASFYGLAGGTARGALPSAKIAAYKACWDFGCADEDVLAAFDDAIRDGVDVISVSLGPDDPRPYHMDTIAIGAFHAVRHGILTCTSAGNAGPALSTVTNTAPWLLTVAASTIDRRFETKLTLRNHNITIQGAGLNTFPTSPSFHPLIDDGFCPLPNPQIVRGKIMLCYGYTDGSAPLKAGATGVVVVDDGISDMDLSFPLPATVIRSSTAKELITDQVSAKIHKTLTVADPKAPRIASFSSRGPSNSSPDTMKPDISAPGVGILASWSPRGSASAYPGDDRSVHYNIISGTSMACPHVTGAAAYVKSHHPNWSPSAIMSALITTATPMDESSHPDLELAHGAGLVNPHGALHPGLVYEISPAQYAQSLCRNGYTTAMLRLLTGDNSTCKSSSSSSYSIEITKQLNLPSMMRYEQSDVPKMVRFWRTVTNVGVPNSTYHAIVKPHSDLNITVTPPVLFFGSVYERKSFAVEVRSRGVSSGVFSSSVTWVDGVHRVRSPVVLVGNI